MNSISPKPNTSQNLEVIVERLTQHNGELSESLVDGESSTSLQIHNTASDVQPGVISSLYDALLSVFSFCQSRIREILRDPSSTPGENSQSGSSHTIPKAEKSSEKAQFTQAQRLNVARSSEHQGANITTHQCKIFISIFSRIVLWGDVIQSGTLEATGTQAPRLLQSSIELLVDCGKDILTFTHLLSAKASEPAMKEGYVALLGNSIKQVEHVVKPGFRAQQHFEVMDNNDSNSSMSTTDIEMVLESLDCTVELLMDLLPSIEHVRDFEEPVTLNASESVGGLETSEYIRQVALNYLHAPQLLIERLGRANQQRFHRLRIRMMKDELSGDSLERVHHVPFVFPTCSISGIAATMNEDSDDDIDSDSIGEHSDDDKCMEQSSGIEDSLGVIDADDIEQFRRLPPEPAAIAAGLPFVCNTCDLQLRNVHSRIEWIAHLYSDLRPYVCLHDSCRAQLATFATRSAWTDHALEHRKQMVYDCRDCNIHELTGVEFEQHIGHRHADLNNFQRPIFQAAACRVLPFESKSWVCCLCHETNFASVERYCSHVCRHLEDVAWIGLATLPGDLYDSASSAVEMPALTDADLASHEIIPQATITPVSFSEPDVLMDVKPSTKRSQSESLSSQSKDVMKKCLAEIKKEAGAEEQTTLEDIREDLSPIQRASFESILTKFAPSSENLQEKYNSTKLSYTKTEVSSTETQDMIERLAKTMTPAQAIYLVTQNETLRGIIRAIIDTQFEHSQDKKFQAHNEHESTKYHNSTLRQLVSPQDPISRLLKREHIGESVSSLKDSERQISTLSKTKTRDGEKNLQSCTEMIKARGSGGLKPCGSAFTSASELRKHKKRHKMRYGCTFDSCFSKFGTKWEWKRHENLRHIQNDAWRCRYTFNDLECRKLFTEQKDFEEHLAQHLGESNTTAIADEVEQCHLHRKWLGSFWCGYCRCVIRSQKLLGRDMEEERWSHITTHIDQGHQPSEWVGLAAESMTKGEMQQLSQADDSNTKVNAGIESESSWRGDDSDEKQDTDGE